MERQPWRQTSRKTPQLDWVPTWVTSLRRDLVRDNYNHTSDPGWNIRWTTSGMKGGQTLPYYPPLQAISPELSFAEYDQIETHLLHIVRSYSNCPNERKLLLHSLMFSKILNQAATLGSLFLETWKIKWLKVLIFKNATLINLPPHSEWKQIFQARYGSVSQSYSIPNHWKLHNKDIIFMCLIPIEFVDNFASWQSQLENLPWLNSSAILDIVESNQCAKGGIKFFVRYCT